MAKKHLNNFQIIYLCFNICFGLSFTIKAQPVRTAVWNEAQKDVDKLEGRNNSGFEKYFLSFKEIQKYEVSGGSAYCGLGLYYWYIKGGVNPNIKQPQTALSFKKYCLNAKYIPTMTLSQLQAIKKGETIVYKTKHSYHVGLLEKFQDFNFYTIEANTSNSRSIKKYSTKREGVFYLKTKLQGYNGFKPLYICDCIIQGTIL